jgi:hypothetical protein
MTAIATCGKHGTYELKSVAADGLNRTGADCPLCAYEQRVPVPQPPARIEPEIVGELLNQPSEGRAQLWARMYVAEFGITRTRERAVDVANQAVADFDEHYRERP